MTDTVAWEPSYRLIAARLPRADIFEKIADPGDLEAVLALEALTNPRLVATLGPLQRIAPADRVSGPGAAYVMAPFAYPSDARFSDALRGAYYAARSLATAIAEVTYHRARFAARTPTPPMDFDERIVEANVIGDLRDVRGERMDAPIYDPASYAASQAFARSVRDAGGEGIVYRSVRDPHGECLAAFVPRLVRNARTAGYLGLRWDGSAIIDSYRKESLTTPYPE